MSLPSSMDLSKVPLMPNPSGAPPDFEHGPSLHHEELGSGTALIILAGCVLILRLATNLRVSRKISLDDLLCVSAFIGGVSYFGLNLYMSAKGATKHAWDIPVSFMSVSMAKVQVALMFIIAPTFWAAKSAILALYIRVFGTITWLRRTAYVWIVFMAMFYSMNIVVAGVYCVPRKDEMWGAGTATARCVANTWPHVVIGVFSCLADLFILVLPFPIVLKLKITSARKVTLTLVFGTGFILICLSAVSLYFRVLIYRGIDPTWNASHLTILTNAELFGTILVSCTPALSSFWHNIFTETTLWSGIKSSSIYSSLKYRFSQHSADDVRPSFVHTVPSWQSSKDSHEIFDPVKSTPVIFTQTTYAVSEKSACGSAPNSTDFITRPVGLTSGQGV